jgi:hypothetical protein
MINRVIVNKYKEEKKQRSRCNHIFVPSFSFISEMHLCVKRIEG